MTRAATHNQAEASDAETLFLPRDVPAEKSVARLRLVAAVMVTPGALVILARDPNAVGASLAIVALLLAVGWTMHFWRTRSLPTGDGLHVDHHGIKLLWGRRDETVAWADVSRVAINEDRLRIELVRLGDEPFLIPMAFPGWSLDELHQTLERHFDASQTGAITHPTEPAAGPHGGQIH